MARRHVFDETYIEFADPDGLKLELVVADQSAAFTAWANSPVPAAMQFRGFHSVTLAESGVGPTQALLDHPDGLDTGQGAGRPFPPPGAHHWASLAGGCSPYARRSRRPARHGTVHHVAFRVDSDATQQAWRNQLREMGYHVSR